MDRHLFKTIFFLYVISVGASLAAIQARAEIRVETDSDSTLQWVGSSSEKRPTQVLQAGVPTSLTLDSPAEILSPTTVPVILIPVKNESEVRISPPKLKEVLSKIREEEIDERISQVMGSLHDIQNLIQKKKLDQASSALDQLEQKYSGVHFLEFTRASILLLKGNRQEALQTARSALAHAPDYEEGKRFVKELEGGSH